MKRYVLILALLCLAFSCKETPPEPPPYVRSISLTVEDTSCTEAWLKLTLTSVSPPQTIQLKRDNQLVQTVQLATPDSIVVDTGLAPHRTYTYKAYRLSDSRLIDSSTVLPVTTMDTTSHNFTWQVDTLGDGSSSVLYDVAIINDTLAYAVGELYLSGDPRRYNLAIWNGISWRVERLMYQGSPPVIRSVFAGASNDVWLDPWFHWNGQSFQEVPINPVFIGIGVNKMWGNPAGQLYAVGNGGFIAYSPNRGGTWQRVESATTIDVKDIWGVSSGTSTPEILAIASNVLSFPQARKLLKLQGNGVSAVIDSGLPLNLSSLWFVPDRTYYVIGDGVYQARHLGNFWSHDTTHPLIYKYAVRGNGLNDVVIGGGFGLLSHFNGVSWRHYQGVELPSFFGSYFSVIVKRNLFIAVGWMNDRAIVLTGVRR